MYFSRVFFELCFSTVCFTIGGIRSLSADCPVSISPHMSDWCARFSSKVHLLNNIFSAVLSSSSKYIRIVKTVIVQQSFLENCKQSFDLIVAGFRNLESIFNLLLSHHEIHRWTTKQMFLVVKLKFDEKETWPNERRLFQWNVQFQSPRWRIARRFLIWDDPRPTKYAGDGRDDDGYAWNDELMMMMMMLVMIMMMRFCNDDGFPPVPFLICETRQKYVGGALRVNGGELPILENESQLFMDLNPFSVERNSMKRRVQKSWQCHKCCTMR